MFGGPLQITGQFKTAGDFGWLQINGNELVVDDFPSCHGRGKKKRNLSPHEKKNLRPLNSKLYRS